MPGCRHCNKIDSPSKQRLRSEYITETNGAVKDIRARVIPGGQWNDDIANESFGRRPLPSEDVQVTEVNLDPETWLLEGMISQPGRARDVILLIDDEADTNYPFASDNMYKTNAVHSTLDSSTLNKAIVLF